MANSGERIRRVLQRLLPQLSGLRPAVEQLARASEWQACVLLDGGDYYEREALARRLLELSNAGPFARVRCAGHDESSLRVLLLGRTHGPEAAAGAIGRAAGGLLFCDDVEMLPKELQYRLQVFTETGEYTPVDSPVAKAANTRLVFGTSGAFDEAVAKGQLRPDFAARASVIRIPVASVNERGEDLVQIAPALLREIDPRRSLTSEASAAITAHTWRGGLAELDAELERICIMLSGSARPVEPTDFRDTLRAETAVGDHLRELQPLLDSGPQLRDIVEAVEKVVIADGLTRTHQNRSQLAKDLGISRSNLIQKIKKYGL